MGETEQDRQVEDLMGRLKDPTTSRIIWLCGKCNYTTSNSDKSRSSKFKMKRHILRLHIEGADLHHKAREPLRRGIRVSTLLLVVPEDNTVKLNTAQEDTAALIRKKLSNSPRRQYS